MELVPADLGDNRAVDLFRMRATTQFSPSTRRGGRLRAALGGKSTVLDRYWGRETGLSEPAATTAIKSVNGQLLGMLGGFGGGWGFGFGMPAFMMATVAHQPIGAAIFGLFSATGFAVGVLAPKAMVRKWGTTPLSDNELEELLQTEDDALERSFLLLIREALRHPSLPEAAQKELKEAIRVLGSALDRLPAAPAETALRDASSLRTEASHLQAQALQEPDRVAAESLERRAEALHRSAAAVEKSSTLFRRNTLLRQELQAQLEALRLELTSSSVGGTDTSGLAQVAQVARGVAREADALAQARVELEAPVLQSVGGTS